MATRFDYTKLIVENINKIVPMVILVITTLGASTVIQTMNVSDAEAKGIKDVREVAKGFQAVLAEKPQKQQVRTCRNCQKLINTHERRFH